MVRVSQIPEPEETRRWLQVVITELDEIPIPLPSSTDIIDLKTLRSFRDEVGHK